MTASHLEFLVEEPSMEAFLRALLPCLLPEGCTFGVHSFQGKSDLLGKLKARLRGYAQWLPKNWRIVVLIDRDSDDCHRLKESLEAEAASAKLLTRSKANGRPWQLVNRIAVEELEAWYFGDWTAVRCAYPKVSAHVSNKEGFRDSDAICGGTWESFERTLQRYGYFKTGLRKIEAARAVGSVVVPRRSRSKSFSVFYEAILEATV